MSLIRPVIALLKFIIETCLPIPGAVAEKIMKARVEQRRVELIGLQVSTMEPAHVS